MDPVTRRGAVALCAGTTVAGLALLVALTVGHPVGSNVDDLVLGLAAGAATTAIARRVAGMTGPARRPWRWLAAAGVLLTLACLATGSGLAPSFGQLSGGDLLLLVAAAGSLVCCLSLARLTRRQGSGVLRVADILILLLTALVTGAFYLVSPRLGVDGVPQRLAPLLVIYGCYAATAIALPSAVLVATRPELRRAASLTTLMVALQGIAGMALGMSLDRRSTGWEATADVALLLSLAVAVAAVAAAPRELAAAGRQTRVGTLELGLTVATLVALPVSLIASRVSGRVLSVPGTVGVTVVMLLLVFRTATRIGSELRLSSALGATEDDVAQLVEASSDGLAVIDEGSTLLIVSPSARLLLGLAAGELGVQSMTDLVHAADRAELADWLSAELAADDRVLHVRVARPEGSLREIEVTLTERPTSRRRVLHLRDVTDRRARERVLERMAFTDHLTQLANRAQLFAQMADREDGDRCLLVLDLDGFKAVNDMVGHEAGDHLLVEVGRRLRALVRDGDLVARLGGDEFAVLVHGSLAEAVDIAQRVIASLSRPHRAGSSTFAIGVSIGAAELRSGAGQLAFRQADAALRDAKQAGKGVLRTWTDQGAVVDAAEDDLLAALEDGHVQLRVSVHLPPTGSDMSLYVTPVWVHPVAGTLPSVELWALAERQGVSRELGRWVMAAACTEVAGVHGEEILVLDVPSAARAEDLADAANSALDAELIEPGRLVLNVPEQLVSTGTPHLLATLTQLQGRGVLLTLDDHGMGQTLFAHLDRLPFQGVGVRLETLSPADDLARTERVLRAIVALADSLGLRTVARGVDTPEQLAAVRGTGVHHLGGAVFPHDLTVAELHQFLDHQVPDELGGDASVPSRGGPPILGA